MKVRDEKMAIEVIEGEDGKFIGILTYNKEPSKIVRRAESYYKFDLVINLLQNGNRKKP